MKSILKKYSILIIFTPILKSVEVIFELIIPILILKVVNTSNIEIIKKNIIFIFLLYLIGFITSVISQYLASITAHKIGHELRKITFKKVMDNKNFDYSKQTNIVTNDIKEVVNGINIFIRLGLRAPILMIGSIIMSFLISPISSLVFLISGLLITIFIIIIMKICSKINKNILDKQDKQFKDIINDIEGIKTIKSYNKINYETNRLIKNNKEIKKENTKLELINSLSNPFIYFIMQFAIIFMLLNLDVKKDIIALINYMNQILLSITVLINSLIVFIKSNVSYKRIKELLDEPLDNKKTHKIDSIDSIEFINVEGINLKLNKNQSLGVIGSTGSGKSTFINYINFKNNKKGKILINNIDINDIEYSHLIGNVFQKPQLFNDTLKYNITLNKKKDIKNMLFDVNLDMPEDKVISELGNNLSGGEKQRISLARAIMKNPQMYILDDASSALDYKTEKQIINKIFKQNNSIKIIVSSRINTIKDCDLILFMDELIIGTHEENMKNIKYKKLYESQKVEL